MLTFILIVSLFLWLTYGALLATGRCGYKIIHVNKIQLILTKGPFHIKTYVYMRDHMANMPWVDNKGNRPKDYLLRVALCDYKSKNRYNLYTLDNQFIEKTDDYPFSFTGIIEYADGSKYWYINGKCHRLDGPAIEWADGSKQWYVDGKRHRLDGPAYEWADGTKEWFIDGKEVSEEQCKLLYSIMKLKGLSIHTSK